MSMKTLEMKSLRNWKYGTMRENFKGFLKMQVISSMRAYRGTLTKRCTRPARCVMVGKYAVDFRPLGNSDHTVVSVFIFSFKPKRGCPFSLDSLWLFSC